MVEDLKASCKPYISSLDVGGGSGAVMRRAGSSSTECTLATAPVPRPMGGFSGGAPATDGQAAQGGALPCAPHPCGFGPMMAS